MAKATIFREYNIIGSLIKSKIYVNGNFMSKIGNNCLVTLPLPRGEYQIFARNPQLPIPFRKKALLYSNTIKININDNEEYHLNLCPHPLFGFGKHKLSMTHLFRAVESMLLYKQDENSQENLNHYDQIKKQIQSEVKCFRYHTFTLILIIAISLFAIISNIIYPGLYTIGVNYYAWGWLLGISNLIGLFNGVFSKFMLATGWEHKVLSYTAFGILISLYFIPNGFQWQKDIYFFSFLATAFWAYACFKRWKLNKKGLDKIDEEELAFECSL